MSSFDTHGFLQRVESSTISGNLTWTVLSRYSKMPFDVNPKDGMYICKENNRFAIPNTDVHYIIGESDLVIFCNFRFMFSFTDYDSNGAYKDKLESLYRAVHSYGLDDGDVLDYIMGTI
jgi:hypothetical protein